MTASAGASDHCPFSGVPSSAERQAASSKRGQHSQSIEPSRLSKRGGFAVAQERIVLDRDYSSFVSHAQIFSRLARRWTPVTKPTPAAAQNAVRCRSVNISQLPEPGLTIEASMRAVIARNRLQTGWPAHPQAGLRR